MNMADALNDGCACATLQPALLRQALADAAAADLGADLAASHPHLFSASPVFLGDSDARGIRAAVAALHRVALLPALAGPALEAAPAIARLQPQAAGVFMGYDFHLTADGPRLIEVNTNAGGALLHAAAFTAHRGCCDDGTHWPGEHGLPGAFEATVAAMFRSEWEAVRGSAPLRRVAIVDTAPATQYLAPEFELARQLLLRSGIDAVICDPGELTWDGRRLMHAAAPVDLVYNRLTDFHLAAPANAALATAFAAGAVVLTPSPRAHALHADKRNLVRFGDTAILAAAGALRGDCELLTRVVPATHEVTPENAAAFWSNRKRWFFKPAAGYGSKAAYRGDKLTRGVWEHIRAGGFVAQAFVPPSERLVPLPDGTSTRLRLDVRAFAFRGQVQLLAARTYAGQTTNFRTPGGGFAPVVIVPSMQALARTACI